MKNRIMIAGPCSAESHLQMMNAAAALSLIDNSITLRAGCWKPRTGPGGFEGEGENAVRWLKHAATSYGLQWITEAGTAPHAETLLKHGAQQLWVGARTTGDPFAVEEIALALKGTQMKVWIKNPPQPDLKLWVGAIERMQRHNVHVEGLIHRGFKSGHAMALRNQPMWSMIDELRDLVPDLPIICDASHIAGRSDMVGDISIRALELGAEGLMIEMHPDPAKAKTDKEQQLEPTALLELLQRLQHVDESDLLERLRKQIDEADEQLWALVRERLNICARIGVIKNTNGLEILQCDRRDKVQRQHILHAALAGADSDDATRMFRLLHTMSVKKQNEQSILQMA